LETVLYNTFWGSDSTGAMLQGRKPIWRNRFASPTNGRLITPQNIRHGAASFAAARLDFPCAQGLNSQVVPGQLRPARNVAQGIEFHH
jgi:hypothetical protein